MAKTIEAQGTYSVRDTDEQMAYSYSYEAFDSLDDAIESIGNDKAKSLIQRMTKVDANNLAREAAKSANGHSTRPVLSEEQKAERKVVRQQDREIISLLKSKGLSLDDIKGM